MQYFQRKFEDGALEKKPYLNLPACTTKHEGCIILQAVLWGGVGTSNGISWRYSCLRINLGNCQISYRVTYQISAVYQSQVAQPSDLAWTEADRSYTIVLWEVDRLTSDIVTWLHYSLGGSGSVDLGG